MALTTDIPHEIFYDQSEVHCQRIEQLDDHGFDYTYFS